MKYEYLIFNIIVLSGPLFFGSLKQFYFLDKLKNALLSILISAIPFLLWDAAVTDRHWFFASEYTLGFRIFGLPVEEILFFFTVPYACLFTWQMVKQFSPSDISVPMKFRENLLSNKIAAAVAILFFTISLIAIAFGKEYTSLATFIFSLSILFDRYWGSKIITTKRFLFYFLFVSFFTLIFNGYLTWRPIVTYDEIYQIGFRIFTIPIEDFFFGYALLILSTSIFEKMIGKNKRT